MSAREGKAPGMPISRSLHGSQSSKATHLSESSLAPTCLYQNGTVNASITWQYGTGRYCFWSLRGLAFRTRLPSMAPHEQVECNLVPVPDERVREYLLAKKVSEIPHGWIKPEVRESWQRCLDANLDPEYLPDVPAMSAGELKDLREQHAKLNEIARMEVQNLYSQISGSNFMVAFATDDAVILETVADPSFRRLARRSGIVAGSRWEEQLRGTNALGCAAHTQHRSAVHATEHFFQDNCRLTCIASPVFDHEERLIGVIDASSDCNSRQIHTVALIRMAALHIEAEAFRSTLRQHLIIQFHNRREFVHTFEAGLIALGLDGCIVATNRQARFFLQDLPIVPGRPFEGVFRKSFDRFLAETAAPGSGELTDERGSTYKLIVSSPPDSRVIIQGGALRPDKKRQSGAAQPDFVCDDPAVLDAIRIVEGAIPWHVPIFIRGETGCGKELLARHVHKVSGRTGKFVAVNCTALPEALIESEFFGYRDGAFTGGRQGGSRGLIRDADKGTLFLDEIGDMAVALQARLLRFLDQGTVRAIGSSSEEKVDVQLLAATNCDIEEAVGQKRFRPDLLYRIRGVEVSLPPLRERSDFSLIARKLLKDLAPECALAEEAIEILRRQRWPGNFRELKHLLVKILIVADSTLLLPSHVLSVLDGTGKSVLGEDPARKHGLRESKGKMILEAFRRCDGNVVQTAKELAVSRNTVYRQLRKSGLR
jgi:transcriptional regulator of acetoin/glycerol metabolism